MDKQCICRTYEKCIACIRNKELRLRLNDCKSKSSDCLGKVKDRDSIYCKICEDVLNDCVKRTESCLGKVKYRGASYCSICDKIVKCLTCKELIFPEELACNSTGNKLRSCKSCIDIRDKKQICYICKNFTELKDFGYKKYGLPAKFCRTCGINRSIKDKLKKCIFCKKEFLTNTKRKSKRCYDCAKINNTRISDSDSD